MTNLELLNNWLAANEDLVQNAQELYDATVEAFNL